MKSKWLKIISVILCITGGLAFFSVFWVDMSYEAEMPRQPTGARTLELSVNHGKNVFVTEKEYEKYKKCDTISYVGWVVFMTGICLGVWLPRAKRAEERKRELQIVAKETSE